jgi:topoisomerase IA-like protein
MESENIVLGKINKKKCYLNEGKYGHYLSYDGKNFKVPEWFPVEKFDIDIAEQLITNKTVWNEKHMFTALAEREGQGSMEKLFLFATLKSVNFCVISKN